MNRWIILLNLCLIATLASCGKPTPEKHDTPPAAAPVPAKQEPAQKT